MRSPRFEVLRRLHAIDATRLHERSRWVVPWSISRPFDAPRRLSTHHVVWIGLSGTVDRIQYGAPKISPLVGYRGAGMSKDPVKKVSKLNRIFVLTQRPFPSISQLQLCENGVSTISRHRDAVDGAVRASTHVS